ncbi:LexA family protein [Ruminococcus sp.]|uniref:LexA family protein n=1 Tax=Ruminococcus sp. TaxID=41978 RepID=UPI00388D58FE
MATFAERFCEALSIRKISPVELSRALDIPESAISHYKKGLYEPKQRRTQAIAKYLNVSIAWLMGADTPFKPYEFDTFSPNKVIHRVPVLGRVAAGYPIEAVENIIDYEEISEAMARSGEYFALQVKGDSMLPRFTDGDIVIVRKQEDVDSGDIAIMLVNGDEATIKKVQKFEDGINLIPSNPAYDVMTFTKKEILSLPVVCLGKVVELRAKF